MEISRRRLHNSEQLIGRLPSEVLSQITNQAYGKSLPVILITRREGTEYPMLTPWIYETLRVSYFWRACTVSTPQLWTVFMVSMHSGWDTPEYLEFLKWIAPRSGDLPVMFLLELEISTQRVLSSLLRTLGDILCRCQSLRVALINEEKHERDPSPFLLSLPAVRDLYLDAECYLQGECLNNWSN